MATRRFIDFVKNDLKTSNVTTMAPALVTKGTDAERTEIFDYFKNTQHADVKCYAIAVLLIKVNLEPCILSENIVILEKSFMLIDKYPHAKNLILYEIALAL
ncbi:hypothetical protein SteCoe_24965 [Stentor coeruleus]|uniref:Uncharacterized protein n=1 Tax=Stentor coeruleus TaxID=5963 RepID=A0A1R2BGR3_9CILI|nr:hypothetical protein SteCoe_24965 [Stentor coeruleus]